MSKSVKIIDRFLDKFGLIRKKRVAGFRDLKKNPYTEEELTYMLAELLNDDDLEIRDEVESRIFKELKQVEGLVEYLKDASMKDILRYFSAKTPQEQLVIRGSFARTNYLKTRIVNVDKKKGTEKIDGVRYG